MRRTRALKSRSKSRAPKAPRRSAVQPSFRIGFLVHDVSRMRRTLFDQIVRPLGLTRAQWWALANLSRHETEGMIQSDLARLMKVGKVTVGGLIDRLEASGQVERRPDGADRRLKRLFITDRGYEVIARMGALRDELNAVILKGVPREQVRITEAVMQTMKDNMRHALGDQEEDFLANADN